MTVAGSGGISVRCVGLRHVYQLDGQTQTALDDIDLEIAPGQSVAVLGPSGSGKSTLLVLLAGLLKPTAGSVYVGEQDVAALDERALLRLRGNVVGFVLQNPARNLLPYGSAEDNVRFARRGARRRRADLPDPRELLHRLDLDRVRRTRTDRLSGGERQRLSLAVGLAAAPRLLLVDEPTSQLDRDNRDRVVALLGDINRQFGVTIIAVTHDDAVADGLERRLILREGQLR